MATKKPEVKEATVTGGVNTAHVELAQAVDVLLGQLGDGMHPIMPTIALQESIKRVREVRAK